MLGPTEAEVFYSAVSNREFPDPALGLGGQACGIDGADNSGNTDDIRLRRAVLLAMPKRRRL